MATTTIHEFDAVTIKNASIQFKSGGTQEPGQKFGLLGSLEGEPEVTQLTKKAEGRIIKSKSKVNKIDFKIVGHIPVKVLRDIFGLSNDKLKPGIYSYGTLSKGKEFVFTADVIDEFEDVVKLIAIPNCSNSSGFKISIENGSDEVAMLELEITALADENEKFYYEAFVSELSDPTIAENWHKTFNAALVTVPTP